MAALTRQPATSTPNTAADPAPGTTSDPATEITRPGVLALYRALADTLTGPFRDPRVAIPLEIGLVAAWLVIRTATPADGPLYVAWGVVVAVVAVLSPVSGLVVLAATAPFDEPFTVTKLLGLRMLLVFVLAGGVALRVALRPRSMPWSWPVVFAGALLVGTLGSLVIGYRRLGPAFTADSVQYWIAGVGGGLLVLLAAIWIARSGELRPMVAAATGAVVGAAVTLLDYLRPGAVSGGPLEWMVHPKDFGFRISGVIPSPNALAALLLVPVMLLAAAVLFAPQRRVRVLALVGLVPIVPTLYFTYSRTVFVAAFGFAVIAAWRVRRWLGVAVLVVGLVVGTVALPSYLQTRNEGIGGGASQPVGGVLVASDQLRFKAWAAAAGMWRDQPVTGYGFRSYRAIGDRYGDTVLNSPHNEWLRFFAEQGTLGGLVGLAFVLAGLGRLARVPGWLGTGTLAGFLAFVLAASFNNPFLFIQVSLVAFTIVGTGLAWSRRWPAAPGSSVTGDAGTTTGSTTSGATTGSTPSGATTGSTPSGPRASTAPDERVGAAPAS